MTLYQLSVYVGDDECHAVTNSKLAYDAQFVLLQQLLMNQMLDRVVTKSTYFEDDTCVEMTLFDATKNDVKLGDDEF